ncbi:hypothetical protein D3C87_1726100 [compost metagenome]
MVDPYKVEEVFIVTNAAKEDFGDKYAPQAALDTPAVDGTAVAPATPGTAAPALAPAAPAAAPVAPAAPPARTQGE